MTKKARRPRSMPAMLRNGAALALLWCVVCGVSAETVCSSGIGGSAAPTGTGGTGIKQDTGTGGTGIAPLGDTGFGGTGISNDTGTGGTGLTADVGIGGTGIVGVITGFGSICVNGIEVEYNQNTPINDNGEPGRASQLMVGQVVEVLAAGAGERVMAGHINVRDAVLGPVTRVDRAANIVEVLNQPVRWERGTVVGQQDNTPLAINLVKPGQFLRVSGFRKADGQVIASRIDSAPAGQVRVSGSVTASAPDGISVQGVPVVLEPGGAAPALRREVAVGGKWDGTRIRAMRVDVEPPVPFDGKVDTLSLQGRLGARLGDGTFRFANTWLRIDAQTRIIGDGDLHSGRLVQVEGKLYPGNRLEAERVVVGDRVPWPSERDDDSGPDGRRGKDAEGRHHGSDDGDGERSGHGSDDVRSDNSGQGSGDERVDDDRGDNSGSGREDVERPENSGPAGGDLERPERPDNSGSDRDRPEKVEVERPERVERPESEDHSGKD